jgi:hypothetical protein
MTEAHFKAIGRCRGYGTVFEFAPTVLASFARSKAISRAALSMKMCKLRSGYTCDYLTSP